MFVVGVILITELSVTNLPTKDGVEIIVKPVVSVSVVWLFNIPLESLKLPLNKETRTKILNIILMNHLFIIIIKHLL